MFLKKTHGETSKKKIDINIKFRKLKTHMSFKKTYDYQIHAA